MSAVPTNPTTPAAAAAGSPTRRTVVRWIAGAATLTALVVAIAIAVWPASETDKARDDGKAVGSAVAQLADAQSSEEVDAALTDLQDAAASTRDHAGDAVGDQVDQQADALERAADGFVGTHTSGDAFEVDLYQAELNTALDDLSSQADDFRTTGPEVQQAFWDGYDQGVSGS